MTTYGLDFRSTVLSFTRFFKRRRFSSSKQKRRLLQYGGKTRCLFVILFVLLAFASHLYVAFNNYRIALRTIPPRSSLVDRSQDYTLPDPVPRLYERHVKPWRKYPDQVEGADNVTRTPLLSHHRYFVGSAGREVGDGLGHRFLVINYELRLAYALNLTYVHREANYAGLTAFQRNAVDHFFGWSSKGERLTRADLFKKVCQKQGRRSIHKDCVEKTVFCKKLRRGNGLIDNIVEIPEDVTFCMKNGGDARECQKKLSEFAAFHSKPNTLFYTPTRVCSWKLLWSNQRFTRSWFHERYWSQPRQSRMDPRFVNIAVHVRRGDVLNIDGRRIISDIAYAHLIRRAVSIISEEELDDLGGARSQAVDLKFKIHIFSQGQFRPQTSHPLIRYLARKGVFGFHNVNDYDTRYISEDGSPAPDGYWTKLLGNHSRISCDMHVSEDTLQSLEQMLAADVLVGSVSALSVHIGSMLSRGILFLPSRPPFSPFSNKTIEWDATGSGLAATSHEREKNTDDSYFDTEKFRSVWREYRQYIGAAETPFGVPAL